ncbi:MAG TPA: hypothetical protein VK781_08805 [Solirubrobacteraceae bacterium]|jgi:hypothetical protein|nr:hypothetical protein [Solirubrobacteraceae bacterium]
MSSHADPAQDPKEPSRRGPFGDAWVAPDGGAVKLSEQALKMQAGWLRRAKPQPFGFAPSSARPEPERIGNAHGAGTLSSGIATMLGARTPVHTMSMRYGDAADAQAPAAEIISDFHREMQDRDLEETLRDAPEEWTGPTEDDLDLDALTRSWQDSDSQPDIASATIDVVVLGRRRPVPMLLLGDFSAFQFSEGGVLVTIVARHMEPQFPDIVRLSDLEPLISEMERRLETPEAKEAAAAYFAEHRRQEAERQRRFMEQRRNQTGGSS